MPSRYKDYLKLATTAVTMLLIALATYWFANDRDRNEFQKKVSDCQNEIREKVAHHEERISNVESWLKVNRRLPETMTRIEANTEHMADRIGEILIEIRELRGASK